MCEREVVNKRMQPTAIELMAFLGCLCFVVGLFNQLAKTKDIVFGKKQETRSIEPQPLRVQLEQEFVRKDECLQRHGESLRSIEEIKADIAMIRGQREEELRLAAQSRKAIYERIEKVQTDLSREMKDMPTSIVAQLLNTKQLWKT